MKIGSYATYGQENYKNGKERERGQKERERERKRAFIKINL